MPTSARPTSARDASETGASGETAATIRRGDYVRFQRITTRWTDNDVYRHVNNVVYYAFFDTAVNGMLIEAGLLDIAGSPAVGLVVETGCRYFAPVAFPDVVHVGVRVARIGRSSVRYEIALFRNEEDQAAAAGHFVHVYVDRVSNRPVAIPDNTRAFLGALLRAPDAPELSPARP